MKILEFTESDKTIATKIINCLVTQFNAWSNFGILSKDPSNVTKSFQESDWLKKKNDETSYWTNYDLIYNALGDQGQIAADFLFGTITEKGPLLKLPILTSTNAALCLVAVDDLLEAGYAAEKYLGFEENKKINDEQL